jgi:hypothetical protein
LGENFSFFVEGAEKCNRRDGEEFSAKLKMAAPPHLCGKINVSLFFFFISLFNQKSN